MMTNSTLHSWQKISWTHYVDINHMQ